MLAYRRINTLPGDKGEILYSALSRAGLRVYVNRARGIVFDTRCFAPALPPRDRSSLSQIAIPLGGSYVVRRGREHALDAREFLGEGGFPWDERWSGDDFSVLVVEWSAEHGDVLGRASVGRISERDRARFAELADQLARGTLREEAAAATVVSLAAMLRALGVPLAAQSVASLTDGISGETRAFARTLASAESRLDLQPMWSDLERALGRSTRQLRRRREHALAALGRTDDPFRSWMRALRVRTAACLSTARGTTLEEVARAVGYGSARALNLAMHQAGLPSPGALRRLALEG